MSDLVSTILFITITMAVGYRTEANLAYLMMSNGIFVILVAILMELKKVDESNFP